MKKNQFFNWKIYLFSFLLTLFLYGIILMATTFNNSKAEISCKNGFGIWTGDNPWNFFLNGKNSRYYYSNCDCNGNIFGRVELKNSDKNLPYCKYYIDIPYLNNEKNCTKNNNSYIKFPFDENQPFPEQHDGICLCDYEGKQGKDDSCLSPKGYQDYLDDRSKGLWGKYEFGGIIKLHFISFAVLYFIIFCIVFSIFILIWGFRK